MNSLGSIKSYALITTTRHTRSHVRDDHHQDTKEQPHFNHFPEDRPILNNNEQKITTEIAKYRLPNTEDTSICRLLPIFSQ